VLFGESREKALPSAGFMLVSCLAYSTTLEIEVALYSETSIDFERTTWRYIPEDVSHQTVIF
jgi:hypothetical protein